MDPFLAKSMKSMSLFWLMKKLSIPLYNLPKLEIWEYFFSLYIYVSVCTKDNMNGLLGSWREEKESEAKGEQQRVKEIN